jgi:hypothetical protein
MASTARQKLRASASRVVRVLRRTAAACRRRGPAVQAAGPKVASSFVAPPVPVELVKLLRRWTEMDFVRQPQLDDLEQIYRLAPTPGATARIVEYFTAKPELGRLICASDHYVQANTQSAVFQLVYLACAYADRGRTDCLVESAERLLAQVDDEVTRALAVRAIGFRHGLEAERIALDEALTRFPSSYLLGLYQAEFLITTDEIAAANRVVERHRRRIAAELADEIAVAAENQSDLDGALAEDREILSDDKDIYNDAFCRSMWISYYESYNTRNPRQHGDRLLADIYLRQLAELPGTVDVVVDFGSMCAQPLFEAAGRMPNTAFYACDRQPLIKELNERAYRLPNLHFRAMDIFEMLAEAAKLPGRKVLTHVRTACVLYPQLVQKLYAACRDAGIDHILLIENADLERSTLRFYEFDGLPARSIVTKHKLYLHDYQAMLADAGFEVQSWARIRTPGLWRGFHPANYLGSQYELHASRV